MIDVDASRVVLVEKPALKPMYLCNTADVQAPCAKVRTMNAILNDKVVQIRLPEDVYQALMDYTLTSRLQRNQAIAATRFRRHMRSIRATVNRVRI